MGIALLATGVEIALAVLAVVSIGVSVASGLLINPKIPKQEGLKDESPSTTATRGTYIPYVLGRRRVGASVGYVGNRTTKKESVGSAPSKGGKKRTGNKQTIYYEDAWHHLCEGPVAVLHAIYAAGKPIFSGGITPTSHPSGTTINLGSEGAFTIYWGEDDQPLGSEVNTAIGANSRWPGRCYVFWSAKRLGTAPRWPILDYEVETRLRSVHLVNSTGNPTASYSPGSSYGCFVVPGGNVARTAAIYVTATIPRSETPIGAKITFDAVNDDDLDGTYTIYDVQVNQAFPLGGTVSQVFTKIIVEEPMPNATAGTAPTGSPFAPNEIGNVTLVAPSTDDGLNHAHMVCQILFDAWPHGLGFDKSKFDLRFFEEAGAVVQSEGFRGSYRAQGGETALVCLSNILQDMGAMLTWDVSQGRFLLKIARADPNAPTIPEELILPPLPEIRTVHGRWGSQERPKADKLVFEFADRDMAYRAMTLTIDDDGIASLKELANSTKIQLTTLNDFSSAAVVAERRSQEELGQGAAYRILVNREARALYPGRVIFANGIGPKLRIMTVKIDPKGGALELNCVTDYYGARKSTYSWQTIEEQESGIPSSTFQEEQPLDDDLLTSTYEGRRFYELPGHLQLGLRTSLLVPRIRAHTKIPAALIWLSGDGTTYRAVTQINDIQTGGELTSAIAADDPWEIEQGATFYVLGSDIATVEDLTGDNVNWKGGRQIAVINDEVFFLRNITALGGSSYRLDGLIRARYDSERAAHAVGDMVYIFNVDSITPIDDLLIRPGSTLYMKIQPVGGVNEIDLAEIPAVSQTVEGKGVAPMKPGALRTANMSSSWKAGHDVHLKWGYRSVEFPGTGAGLQGAGTPTGCSKVLGRFKVEMVTNPGAVVKATYLVEDPMFTYYNEDMVSDFGSEPSMFDVNVSAVHGGLESDAVSLTVEKV